MVVGEAVDLTEVEGSAGEEEAEGSAVVAAAEAASTDNKIMGLRNMLLVRSSSCSCLRDKAQAGFGSREPVNHWVFFILNAKTLVI